MRKFVATLLFMLSVCAFINAQTEELPIEVKHDRFKDWTSITLGQNYMTIMFSKMRKQPQLMPSISYKGKTPPGLGVTVNLGFFSVNDSWKYLKSHDLYCLADDQPIELPETNHRGEVMSSGSVLEVIHFDVSYETFEVLCKASKLEFKLHLTEFKLSEKEQTVLKQFKQVYEEEVKKHEKEK
ncbi:hypothetical protein KA005_74375 [bacterium]|nr:hypothetical protein [bacterium]